MSITPMSRLKTSIKQIKTLLNGLIIKDYVLNQSSPKYNPYGGDYYMSGNTSKGVENEFLRIFHTSSDKSFAFIFNNIKKDLDRVIISVSIKNTDDYFQRNFSFEEFKTKLKELKKTLSVLQEVNSLTEDSFYVALSKIFRINEKIDEDKEAKKVIAEIKKEISKNKRTITLIQNKKHKLDLEGSKDLSEINKQVNSLKRTLKYKRLKEQYEQARKEFQVVDKKVKNKEEELKKEFKIQEKQSKSRAFSSEVSLLEKSNVNILKTMLAPYPKKFQEKIKLSFKKA